jgi:hypothetical protein
MNNATHAEIFGATTNLCPNWCDVPPSHAGDHDGMADFPKVTATADREAFMDDDDGVLVPEVVVRLMQHDEPSSVVPQLRIALSIICPRDCFESSASCSLTLDEAGLLRKHLTALLREVGQEVAW